MIRGIQKNMILIQIPKSPYFESAYFVMRANPAPTAAKNHEMLKEVHRILAENDLTQNNKHKNPRKSIRRPAFAFCCGLLSGIGISSLLGLIILLIG